MIRSCIHPVTSLTFACALMQAHAAMSALNGGSQGQQEAAAALDVAKQLAQILARAQDSEWKKLAIAVGCCYHLSSSSNLRCSFAGRGVHPSTSPTKTPTEKGEVGDCLLRGNWDCAQNRRRTSSIAAGMKGST